jgi:signal transduction histidine kinase/DNA-binding response OmpR family regulator/ligand-binding sensor domain-containing protein
MRTCHVAILLVLLPGLLRAQLPGPGERFLLVPPGIATRLEKCEAFPAVGRTMILGFAPDHNGFLWVRTNQGLARFDGYELKVYRENPADTNGTARAQLSAIAVDGDGFVWGATPDAGLNKLDPATGESRWYRGHPVDSTSIGTGATRLFVTSDGELWAGTRFGLAEYKSESDSFIQHNLPRECRILGNFPITSLCEIGRSIWVGLTGEVGVFDGGGILEFRRDDGGWKRHSRNATTRSVSFDYPVRAVCADRTGRLWIGTRFGLDRYDPRTNSWDHFTVSQNTISMLRHGAAITPSLRIWAIVEDEFGGIWIASDGAGIFRFDPEAGTVVQFRHSDADATSIPTDFLPLLNAPRMRPDRRSASGGPHPANSVVWIPNGYEGAHRVIVRRDPCTSVVIRNERALMGGPAVCNLSHDEPGKIWAASYNGNAGHFDLPSRKVRWYQIPQAIAHLSQLRDRTVLVSTRLSEAWMYVKGSDTFVRFVPDLRIHRFLEESDSLLWLGCSSRLGMSFIASVDRRTGRCSVYPRQDPDSASYRDESVTAMSIDSRGDLWYGTRGGGLIRFDLKRKAYRRYSADPYSDNALISNDVSALTLDSAGMLWVGTVAGLALMDCDRGTFEHLHNSLEENSEAMIRGMADDGEGHLWISSHEGVFCLTKATREFRTVTPPPQFHRSNFHSATFDRQTRAVTIGGAGGFFMFSIDDPPATSPPPPIVLTSFKVFEKFYPLAGEVSSLASITLPHSANFFSFTFAALDYTNPAKNRYAYRLEGFDSEWVMSGSRRYLSYSNLNPGRYVLKVKGTNSEGIWNDQGTAIEIIVTPPWYRTFWAYGVYASIAGVLLCSLYTYDRKRTALKHNLRIRDFEARKMYEVDQMKSRFFANISHEFRTPLTLILGVLEQPAGLLNNDAHAHSMLSMMRRNGLRLLQLINQLLDLSRMDAGMMPVQVCSLDLVELARPLVMAFVPLAERKRIHLTFRAEEEIAGYTDRDKFEKILVNLLSNAFKFTGEGGEITVITRIGHDPGPRTAEILVSDTGIGVEPQNLGKLFDRFYQVDSELTRKQDGTGIGLALAKELVDILRGSIGVESTPGRGTTFTVRLPLGKEHWSATEKVTDGEIRTLLADHSDAVCAGEEETETGELETEAQAGASVVLVVEDNADVRAYLRGFLGGTHKIIEARNGQEALKKAHDTTVDLVISDIMMPVMDGIALCKALKSDETTSHIPIILLTARASSEGKLEGLDTGADDYIIKPFDARELTARAKNLIGLRRSLREKYGRQVILGPSRTEVKTIDERFLQKLAGNLEQHIADADYDTATLAHDMCMSRMQLNRKIHALTGHSTHALVREYRLERAAELLRRHADVISGIAYDVGFKSLAHFSRAFRSKFGIAPSKYEAQHPEQARKRRISP